MPLQMTLFTLWQGTSLFYVSIVITWSCQDLGGQWMASGRNLIECVGRVVKFKVWQRASQTPPPFSWSLPLLCTLNTTTENRQEMRTGWPGVSNISQDRSSKGIKDCALDLLLTGSMTGNTLLLLRLDSSANTTKCGATLAAGKFMSE